MGLVVVFYTSLPLNISTYTLKLFLPDGTEGDSESWRPRNKYMLCDEEEKSIFGTKVLKNL